MHNPSLKVIPSRVRNLSSHKKLNRAPILYWMRSNMRVTSNWALIAAVQLAEQLKQPLFVVFCVSEDFSEFFRCPTLRHLNFLIQGLKEVEKDLRKLNIGFYFLKGKKPIDELAGFIKQRNVQNIVSDFCVLKAQRSLTLQAQQKLSLPFFEVDATHIIPLWESSSKQEFAAYTLRPKIHKRLPEFLTPYPKLQPMSSSTLLDKPVSWPLIEEQIQYNNVAKLDELKPGPIAAQKVLKDFIDQHLKYYHEKKNDPTAQAVSNLSPYLHFGHISAQEVALKVMESKMGKLNIDTFLEELIVRRELSANFCFYNKNYDSHEGFPSWAKKSLDAHLCDAREYIYTLEDFENARTHDDLWNAAQKELVSKGKMHGYVRMYWAKKILEWTKHYQTAFEIAIYLNDKYELDGNDPNGYVGVAWSIGGVHDRAWFDRPIFGKIRYMNKNGCQKKFNVERYIAQQAFV